MWLFFFQINIKSSENDVLENKLSYESSQCKAPKCIRLKWVWLLTICAFKHVICQKNLLILKEYSGLFKLKIAKPDVKSIVQN